MFVSLVGCQSDFNGQTLPSAWWQGDDVQYFQPGHEFKLYREAAAMKAAEASPEGLQAAPMSGGPGMAPAPSPMVMPAPLGTPMGAPIPVPAQGEAIQ
jgi:hypothetical protein